MNDVTKGKRPGMGNDFILKEIAGMVASLKYGDILVRVHDSRIIQVEKTEKTRYDNYRALEAGCGI
ncbi:MAG TPA: YezD family protein [Candidatus Omnitrophota bacterium]|nr:YezD family protein [Candidatus Omnitrophota bacterium]HPS36369.1 YezD family protein [Candidatus Omnitrophota bacterium]